MTFEEFFKKKKISLDALQQAEPGLFSEFKTHFEQMGEKSFDHTKKYWFNKLRLQYPASVEAKVEKVKIDNPLAEQTITESLEESAIKSKIGFTPKFKAVVAPNPAEEKPVEEKKEEAPATPASTAPKPGFTPRFKAANLPKPAEQPAEAKPEEKPVEEKASEDISTPQPVAPKPGFTPRFKAANMPKLAEKPVEETPAETLPSAEIPEQTDAPKPAYKPRFNPKNLPKKEE
jgi:hypothetical protein